jgi:hypothetical protein
MALTNKDAFEKELRKLLNLGIARISEEITSGLLPDYPAYCRKTSEIDGLKAALEMIDDANSNIEKQR